MSEQIPLPQPQEEEAPKENPFERWSKKQLLQRNIELINAAHARSEDVALYPDSEEKQAILMELKRRQVIEEQEQQERKNREEAEKKRVEEERRKIKEEKKLAKKKAPGK